jgi:hypothetical protein
MNDREIYDEETLLRMRLAEIHRRYQVESEPVIKRLAHIESLKPPRHIFLNTDIFKQSKE